MERKVLWFFLAAFVAILIGLFIYYKHRKQYARKKTAGRSREEKWKDLHADLEPFGFAYDETQDIIYSGMYPWQREFGYCKLYDRAALGLNMAIECEPIYFMYDNRRWLLEFWKGQYGMTTGAEVGIYVTDKENILIPGVFEGPFFDCVKDEERIRMQYVLYYKKCPSFQRKELHWWLTGFQVGQFSKPKHLSMEMELTFPNRAMLEAFIDGLKEAGYEETEYQVGWNTVQIVFLKPKTKQPYRKIRVWFFLTQCLNRFSCAVFRWVTRDYIKALDKLDYLRFLFPWMYRGILRFAKPIKLWKQYHTVKEQAGASREVVG